MRLHQKAAIITGAGSGIGREAAKLFALEGARVVAADKNWALVKRFAEEIRAQGGQASALEVDVSRAEDVRQLIEATVDRLGRLDILLNNAGRGLAGTVVDTSEEEWDALIAANVRSVFLGCKFAIPVVERQGGGAIVNTASAVARIGIPNRAAYVASKGAIAGPRRVVRGQC
jgi:meso-butanediol dehydrogenase/(S,S)-butanediol dehydrogenase/diacetyl reductase